MIGSSLWAQFARDLIKLADDGRNIDAGRQALPVRDLISLSIKVDRIAVSGAFAVRSIEQERDSIFEPHPKPTFIERIPGAAHLPIGIVFPSDYGLDTFLIYLSLKLTPSENKISGIIYALLLCNTLYSRSIALVLSQF